uniref:Uncharacterized protein n=1 Tax=Ailuropoda melanoleuca TaxID=9646 RepID=A0A7N5P2U9_AILME
MLLSGNLRQRSRLDPRDTEHQKDAACLAKRPSSRASYCEGPPPDEQGPFSGHNSHSR